MMAHPDAAAILERVEQENIAFINLQFSDILGRVKSVTIPAHELAECIEHGKWFDGSAMEGFARIAESDMYLEPDLSTFAVIPWLTGYHTTARVICNVYTPDGELFPGDPRTVLRRIVGEAQQAGYMYMAGAELEFFLLHPDQTNRNLQVPLHDQASYFDLVSDSGTQVMLEVVNTLESQNIPVETSHHEVAPGQYEIDFKYNHALAMADQITTARYTIRSVAQKHGLIASFMPKPFFGYNGNGMHTHQSLTDPTTGKNLFYDPTDPYGLSEVGRLFTAGQLAHARGMCAILAPQVNSYKRLVSGYEAPIYITWARTNRAALIRVPRISINKTQSMRIELRCPDPSCNPYLAFAVMLKSGLDGIQRKLNVPAPIDEHLYGWDDQRLMRHSQGMLPGSLNEALQALDEDELVQEALGEHVYESFITAKRREWNEFRIQVTPWEVERYLEL